MLVLADVHGNRPALAAVLADASDEPVRCCGDLVGYYPWPDAVVQLLRERDVTAVRGNHDDALLARSTFGFTGMAGQALRWQLEHVSEETRAFLDALPATHRATDGGRDVFMVHGAPRAPMTEYVYPSDVDASFLDRQGVSPDVLLLGHTHVPFAKRVGDTLVVNPGSVGQPRDGDPRASYAVLDEDGTVTHRRVAYDIDRVADRVEQEGLPQQLADRLYDGR